MRLVPPVHRDREQQRSHHHKGPEQVAAVDEVAHLPGKRNVFHRQQEAKAEPDTVKDAFDQDARKRHREEQASPAGEQVAAQQFPGAERQDFIGEQSDVDRPHSLPECHGHDRTQQQAPSQAMPAVNGDVGDHGDAHPPPVHRGKIVRQFSELGATECPDQTTERYEIR